MKSFLILATFHLFLNAERTASMRGYFKERLKQMEESFSRNSFEVQVVRVIATLTDEEADFLDSLAHFTEYQDMMKILKEKQPSLYKKVYDIEKKQREVLASFRSEGRKLMEEIFADFWKQIKEKTHQKEEEFASPIQMANWKNDYRKLDISTQLNLLAKYPLIISKIQGNPKSVQLTE